MRWYARPEGDKHQLRIAPRLWSMDKAQHPSQVRLRTYLDDTEALLADSRIEALGLSDSMLDSRLTRTYFTFRT
ncbi:hypothetical protein [Mycolicibacterium hippocampi]|uniref:hypothetical protein n=1 Tax=Mycolicibacterium hippocampi TaxID=659824 RepID=UPI0035129922